MLSHISQSDRVSYQQSIRLHHRDVARHLIQMQNLPVLYVVKSSNHSVDIVTGEAVPYMVNIPAYLVDMNVTEILSTGDVAVVDMRKFLRRLG